MSLLPAVVPDIPESRAEFVPARIARKVAPLFGVAWPGSPFGTRTWVSDYGKITISEIARGAPLPTRSQTRKFPTRTDAPWQLLDRVAVTFRSSALPHEIANATLNRFGPDTKAAVVLTAVNRLLAPVTEAVEAALPLVVGRDAADLPVELRLAAWAGLLIEVFRSQPALVAAGIRARTIQRELVVSWHLPLAEDVAGLSLTRCEIGSRDTDHDDIDHDDMACTASSSPDRPRTLDVADRTFRLLRVLTTGQERSIGGADADPVTAERGTDDHMSSQLARRLLREETVDLLLRRLLAVGTPHDASHLWLSEREPGQLAVEAHVPPTLLVDQFVRQAVRSLDVDGGPDVGAGLRLPCVPGTGEVNALSPLARRAVIVGLLTVLRHVQHSPEPRDTSRHEILPLLDRIDVLARRCLDDGDALGVLARCRVADMKVQTLRHDTRNDLREPLADLRSGLRRVQELFRAGMIDRGAAAEAISSANVELNIVRWTNADRPGARLPQPQDLHEELRRSWRTFHDALEIRSASAERAAGYHLHNYAAFLASPPVEAGRPVDGPATDDDLREAVRLFGEVVIPARQAFFERTGGFLPLRHSLQIASRATTRLAESARARGDLVAARCSAEKGHGWIHQALADAGTVQSLDTSPPTERAVRLALLAAPALLVAVEVGAPSSTAADVETARGLVELVRTWERSLGDGAHHARHAEVVALMTRLTALGHNDGPHGSRVPVDQ